jgi:hypothetical protein
MYLIARAFVRKKAKKNGDTKVNIPLIATSMIIEESLAVTMTLTRAEYICID